MPPITPEPSQSSQIWCRCTPSAEMTSPPHQHSAESTPALRGPAFSSQPPQIAAEEPRKTKNIVYIQPSMEIFQSQPELNTCSKKPMSLAHSIDWVMPRARDSGSQN